MSKIFIVLSKEEVQNEFPIAFMSTDLIYKLKSNAYMHMHSYLLPAILLMSGKWTSEGANCVSDIPKIKENKHTNK